MVQKNFPGTWSGHLVGAPGGGTYDQHESLRLRRAVLQFTLPTSREHITLTHSHSRTYTPKDIIRTQKINLLGKKISYAINIAAVETEQKRVDRVKGIAADGTERTDEKYLELQKKKKGWLDAVKAYQKKPSSDTLKEKDDRKKEWRMALKKEESWRRKKK